MKLSGITQPVEGGERADGASRSPASRSESSVQCLNDEQRRSQISGGHRLIRLVRQKRFHLYSSDEFLNKSIYLTADYFLDQFVPSLRMRMNEAIAQRVNAAIARARTQTAAYGVKKAGVAEFVTEAFFDSWWYKNRDHHMSRSKLRDMVKALFENGQTLRLHFPILSRKPFSPVKNRGPHPDLAELHTLTRCAEAAQVINALSPTGCQLIVLADGRKYNRACLTPEPEVAAYQAGLHFWVAQLGVGDIVHLVDYETWLAEHFDASTLEKRGYLYAAHIQALTDRYHQMMDFSRLSESLEEIKSADDIGHQLSFTFWSIVGSVYYRDLFDIASDNTFAGRHYGDDVQGLYVAYLASLHRPLESRGLRLPLSGGMAPSRVVSLFHEMRHQAWKAAIRYVAISLTDRDLNALQRIDPHAIKLTVHGKKGEIHFLSATQQDAAMTAQHCVGGLGGSNVAAKVTFRYRLERESQGEAPLMVERLPDTPYHRERYGPLHRMQAIGQPLGYISDPSLISIDSVHSILTRKG